MSTTSSRAAACPATSLSARDFGPQQAARATKVNLRRLLGVLLVAAGVIAGTLAAKSTTGTIHRALTPARKGQVRRGLTALPVAARGPVSAALGRSDRGYWVNDQGAQNLAQHFATRFTSGGAVVRSGAGALSLRLAAVGRGDVLHALPAVSPQTTANRATFAHPGIREWYANGPLGLEQGFDVQRRSAGDGALTLAVAFSPRVRAQLDGNVARLVGNGISLRYSGLSATDSRGRALHSWLVASPGRLEIRVDDRGAAYPLRIDPFVQQGSKLVASDATADARLGFSVAVSADGNTALVGGPEDTNGAGAAWVFTRSGSTWSQQGSKLVANDATAGASQGFSVALSADGNTALVGGDGDNSSVGAAWVYTRSGSTWSQQGPKLVASDATGPSLQGYSVALSSDGTTAIVGGEDDNGTVGAAWVYTLAGSTWTQQGPKLVASDATADAHQGFSVALSSNGSTALVGGDGDNSSLGAAWVYTRSGSTWSQQGPKLVASDAIGHARQGFSVALSATGATALVGGPGDNGNIGAAWAYVRSGSTWSQQGPKLLASDGVGLSLQGYAVDLSDNGNVALVGAPSDNGSNGAAWIYTRTGSTWAQQGSKLTGADATTSAAAGFGIALSSDGNTALVGGPADNGGQGAVWAFTPGQQSVQHSLSVTIAGNGAGSVAGSGIACPGTCAQVYDSSTSVTLTATAGSGSVFAGWTGACSGTGPCNLAMNSDRKVKATFTPVTGAGGGAGGGAGSSAKSGSETHLPALTALNISPRKLVLTGRFARGVCVAATRSNVGHPVCTRPVKSRISYRLTAAANVTFTIQRVLPGRRFHGRCATPSASNRGHAPCQRLVRVRGRIVRSGNRGNNAFMFNDRIGRRRLGPGTYVLTATPSVNGRSGAGRAIAFVIVK